MTKQGTYTFIAASLAFLVPFPGRLVYGIVLVIELLFLMVIGTCVSSVANKIRLGELKTVLCLMAEVSFTILYKHILILTQTEIAMILGFLLYIPTASSFIIGYIFNKPEASLLERLKGNMVHTANFSGFALIFFLIRDIFGYGTFTFFGKNHIIYEKVLFDSEGISVFSFLASIPGALLLCAVMLFIEVKISHKVQLIRRADTINSVKSENGGAE
ncbi:MAG: hypothetical protein MJ181_06140 [Treponema sp.]|nr:hypothetical protein [Treponema sp.]